MRKAILYIAMSLDGYIADARGGVDWLTGDGSEPEHEGSYPAFYHSIDTVIMGHTTYRQITCELSPGHWVYGDKKCYVITHQSLPSAEEAVFAASDPAALLTRLKGEAGRDIWICGGASVAGQLMKSRLIDEYCISVIPTLLGSGIPLFGGSDVMQRLQLCEVRRYNGIVDLVYRPVGVRGED